MSKTTIREGDHGELVTELQQKLIDRGEDPGPVDGWFGPRTRVAVESFQMNSNIQFDGVVGNQTWAALDGDLSVPPGTSDSHGAAHSGTLELQARAKGFRESDHSVRVVVTIDNTGHVAIQEGALTCELRVMNPAATGEGSEVTLQHHPVLALAPGHSGGIDFFVDAPKLETFYQANVGIFDATKSYAHAEDDFN
ncbi:MAG TPA: peptidoglycan-binding domain-containing protein [Acidimicrobiales bacterium]|nr:peptidoglycan-binding domain-containing protein [Acidimicrobiales bacterium]